MKLIYLLRALPLLIAVTVAGCGGGTATGDRQAGQGGGSADVPAVLATAAFVERAQNEICAESHNRLFVIDKKQVFWDRAGNCPDNAYARRLLGNTPDAVLCSVSDSIDGPRQSCSDEQARPLFETILKNLDKPDLGLGAGHTVEPLTFLPKGAANVDFESIVHDTNSGVGTAKNVVIKDALAWERLWAEHASYRAPLPAAPNVDFNKSMVIAVFIGARPSGCYSTTIRRVYRSAGAIHVDQVDTLPGPGSVCTTAFTAPAHMVVIQRSDDPVRFASEVRTAP